MAPDETSLERLKSALAERYEIDREIGSGGMATVYLAEDLKHHRNVALKVLRPDLAATLGPERFHREIQIAAQLQHPNILPLYDSGEADGFLYYVMPFVDGQSLRERLEREGELPIQEAIRILRDVAEALSEAHANGVVHRDIKPANILLRGRHALVADFGVAKAVSEATGLEQYTTAGVALGTPSYMAPEQASADPHLDHRVDIYALGAVAYELLTGRPTFMGNTPQMILAAHMTEAPQPVRQRREAVPVALEQLVMRCLEKKPADRWQTAEEMLPILESLNTPSGGVAPTSMAPEATLRKRVSGFGWVALFVLGVGAAAIAFWGRGEEGLGVSFGVSDQVTMEEGLEVHPAISPNGNLIAYAAGTANRMRVFIRGLSGDRTFPITNDTTAVQTYPRWSPDGNEVLFLSEGGVWVAPALGGNARTIVAPSPGGAPVSTADWSPDGREVLYVRGDSLAVLGLDHGNRSIVSLLDQGHSCSWSPAGNLIACVEGNWAYSAVGPTFGNLGPSRISLIRVEDGEKTPITDPADTNQSPAWSVDGGMLFFVSNRQGFPDIYGVRVSDDGEVVGEPERLTLGLKAHTISHARERRTLAYSVADARSNIWRLPIPIEGISGTSDADQITFGNQVVEGVAVSRDGRWVVYDSNLRGNSDIYRIPSEGGSPEQLTNTPFDEFAPDLSPDGAEVAYHTFKTGSRDIGITPLDGGPRSLVTSSPDDESYPAWSPDGSRIAFLDQTEPNIRAFVMARNPDGSWGTPSPVADSVGTPRWSPDGKSLTVSPRPQRSLSILDLATRELNPIYQPRPGSGDPTVRGARWSEDGRTIYFKSYDSEGAAQFWSVPASGGRPQQLIQFDDPTFQSIRWEWAAGPSHFYFTVQDRESDIFVVELENGSEGGASR